MTEPTLQEFMDKLEDDFYATWGAIRPVVINFTEHESDNGNSVVIVSSVGPVFEVSESWNNHNWTENDTTSHIFPTLAQAEAYATMRRADPY